MGYDEELAAQVREVVGCTDGVSEMRMFGGLAFLVNGNMAVCASREGGLLLRVDPADTATLSADPHARRFVMRGREMDGWLRIDPSGLTDAAQVQRWVTVGVTHARSLPAKR